jgi:cytochrome c oxidase subunit 3
MTKSQDAYYLPEPSYWPITGSIGLFTLFLGAASLLNDYAFGRWLFLAGLVIFIMMLFGWFGTVIRESVGGKYNNQVDVSFRWGMVWFIFSEVMFFACFFGALFYARMLSVPWLGGEGDGFATKFFLWNEFNASWPLSVMPDPGRFAVYHEVIPAWGIPAINTLVLLTSGATVTFAHWALKKNDRKALSLWLIATVTLGFLFVALQANEYGHAYHELNLTLNSGIYGTTFYMLTGFHGLHVTLGATMLFIIWARCVNGHFTPDRHFAFEAAAWYWHFVDVVWLGLFVFVYWL